MSQKDEEPVSERDNCGYDSDISLEILTIKKGTDLLNVSERLVDGNFVSRNVNGVLDVAFLTRKPIFWMGEKFPSAGEWVPQQV